MVRTKTTELPVASQGNETEINRSGQIQSGWIPGTPFKPILPRLQPIYSDLKEEELIDATWLDSEIFSPEFIRDSRALPAALAQRNDTADRGVAKSGISFERSMNKYENVKFTDLLAIQHSKGDLSVLAEAACRRPETKDRLTEAEPSGAISSSHCAYNRSESTSASMSIGSDVILGSDSGNEGKGNCATGETQIPHLKSYDLNIPLEAAADAISSRTIPEFAPLTPGKVKNAKSNQVSEVQISYQHMRTPERNMQGKEVATVGTDSNSLQQGKELQQPITDSPCDALSTPCEGNLNPYKGASNDTDPNKTLQQKPRRKKHRPKVVTEGKPKGTPKPETPKPKRPYVRRQGLEKPTSTPAEATEELTDKETPEHTKRSCRRALNYDMEGQPRDEVSTSKAAIYMDSEQVQDICIRGVSSELTVQNIQETEVAARNTEVGIAKDFACYTNQLSKDYISLAQSRAPATTFSTSSNTEGSCQIISPNKPVCATQSTGTPSASNTCGTTTILNKQEQAGGTKRKCSLVIEQENFSSRNLNGVCYNSLQTYDMTPWGYFPNIYRKKRTEKGQYSSTSCTSSSVTATKSIRPATPPPQKDVKDKFEFLLAFSKAQKLTRKRSRCIARVPNFASLNRIAGCERPEEQLTVDHDMQRVDNSQKAHTCIEALVAEMSGTLARKKRSKKRNSLVNSVYSRTNKMQLHRQIVISSHRHQSYATTLAFDAGAKVSVDSLVEQLKFLDINREENALVPYNLRNKEHRSLVLYRGDGSIVPFQGSIKKRRPRPKVHLDDETSRVWKLLLGNINSEGIDGTDEEKKKWWEEERSVFRGRADSFIARMHLVQGDRRFSQWKGSVVDSVIGVFLTQNVSDHLSSSAFMSLAARFPLKSKNNQKPPYEEGMSLLLLKEPEASIIHPEDIIKWNQKTSNEPDCDQSSVICHEKEYHEEKRVINSIESRLIGDGVSSTYEPKCKLLDSAESGSENYQDSSQNSADYSIAERIGSCSENNSETEELTNGPKGNSLDGSISSSKHLEMVEFSMPHEISTHRSDNMLPDDMSMDAHHHTKIMNCYKQNQTMANKDSHGSFLTENTNSSSKHTPSHYHLHLTPNSRVLEAQCFDRFRGETGSSGKDENTTSERATGSSGKDENTTSEQSIVTADSPCQGTVQNKLTAGTLEASKFPTENNNSSHYLQGCKNFQSGSWEAGDPKPVADSLVQGQNSKVHQNPNVQTLSEETVYLTQTTGVSGKDENATCEQSILTAESTFQGTVQNKLTVGTLEASNFPIENNNSTSYSQEVKNFYSESWEVGDPKTVADTLVQGQKSKMQQSPNFQTLSEETVYLTQTTGVSGDQEKNAKHNEHGSSSSRKLNTSNANALKSKSRRVGREIKNESNWDFLREQAEANTRKREKTADTQDSIDWEAVRCADVDEIANTIKERGMNNMLAERIKDFLNRLVREHKSIDLEWLRDVPPDRAKEYLLSIRGLGLKSVECVRLLTLHHLAFPVDTNVGRIAVRLGWVPLQPLPESLQLHLLELYPVLESIQKYLWPRLCKLDQRTLYELHYQMITFGKVFCTKNKPNCNACPMRGECRHFASAFASARLALPGPEEKSIVRKIEDTAANRNPAVHSDILSLLPTCKTLTAEPPDENQLCETRLQSEAKSGIHKCNPIIEEPATPEPESAKVTDIEDIFYEDPDEIPTIKLNIDEFTHNLQNYMQGNMELQEGDMSKALVALTPELASIPMPKLKNVNRLRTEHLVYELPDSHPLLIGMDRREPDDPCSYLLAIWGLGETADTIEPPEGHSSSACEDSQTVRGTLLIPCRTAMQGSFPLNGTYFQVNEVFSDHETSLNPIEVPRDWLWNLPRRTVYFGTSVPSIFKGLSTEDIQKCFWRGYVCVRGFDQRTRAPRPLTARLHFTASKLARTKGNPNMS